MSTSDTVNPLLTVNEQMAAWYTVGRSASVEGSLVVPRSTAYGEQMFIDMYGTRTPYAARSGERWTTANTQGTPIVDGNQASFSATAPVMTIFNNNAVGGAWIYPVRLKMVVVAVGTSSTNLQGRWILDTGNRYSSGGSALTPTNANPQVTATKTGAVINFGAITATAASGTQRTINLHQMRVVIPSAGDEYTYEFGNSAPRSAAGAADAAGQLCKDEHVCPIGIPPQFTLLLYHFSGSQAAARSFDHIDFQHDER